MAWPCPRRRSAESRIRVMAREAGRRGSKLISLPNFWARPASDAKSCGAVPASGGTAPHGLDPTSSSASHCGAYVESGNAMRILLADDHALFRHGLRLLLDDAVDITRFDEAGSLDAALELLESGAPPDLMLFDLRMPGM